MGTGNLDGLTELDALAVDVHTELSLDGVSDHSGGNRAKEDALVADLDVNGDLLALEGSLGLVGGSQTDGLALGDVVATLVELLEVALGGGNSELLGEQEVLSVTLSDLYDVTLAALALDLIEKNNLHDASPFLAAVAVATRGNHGDGVRQESHLAGALDGVGDVMLMLRASASDATGLDLATVGHVLTEKLSVLIVDELSVLLAELAVLTTRLTCRIIISHVKIPFVWQLRRAEAASHSKIGEQPLERDVLIVDVDRGRRSHRCGRTCCGRGSCGGVTALIVATLATTGAHKLDLIDDDLKLAPALTVALPRAVAQLALDRDLVSLCQETAHGLGAGAEHSAVDKVGIVLPLASLRVAATIVHGDAKGQNLGSAGGGAQLGIAGEITGDVHSIDAHNSLLPLGAQAQSKTTVLLLVVATDDHVADHSVGDAQDAIKLGDLGRICVEVDEGVVTIGEVVDLVGELALAPLVNGVDLASALSDRGIDTLHNSETSLGVERRVNKEQQFISLHIVTSSGQMWLQVVKVRLKQEKTW